jgi:hypothetical protein
MNRPTFSHLDGLDPDLARRIDLVCRRFEADWRGGRRPPIDDYLADVPEDGRQAWRAELEILERELRQSEETGGRSELQAPPRSTITEAPTLAPAASPTVPVEGPGPSSVHDDATVLPSNPITEAPTLAPTLPRDGSAALAPRPAPSAAAPDSVHDDSTIGFIAWRSARTALESLPPAGIGPSSCGTPGRWALARMAPPKRRRSS